MKKLLTIILLLTFCLTVPAQKKITDREIEGLKDSVKTVFEDYMLTYVSSGPSEVNKRTKSVEYYFDKDGQLTQIIYPSSNSKLIFSVIDGFKTFKSLQIKEDIKNKDIVKTVVTGEQKPIESSEKIVPPDERFTLKYVYEFDIQGRVKTEREYGNNGKLFKLTTFKYDEKGRVIEENVNDTVALSKFTYKYGADGNLIEKLEDRDIKGAGIDSKSRTVYSEYKVDAQGNWTERKSMWTSKGGDDSYTATTIYYRTITYY